MEKIYDTPAPDGINNIAYFYENDSLLNIHSELIFSILGRYNCFAGCKVCYTQKHFQQALPEFRKFIPAEISIEQELEWFKVFDHFTSVSNIDDLFWMKHEHQSLYKWYIKNSHRFGWGNMTDNNFIRTQPLFVNELSAQTFIQEISFSDSWLDLISIKEITSMLDQLNKRNGIGKIKFILTKGVDSENVKYLFQWIKDNGIENFCSHHDFHKQTIKLNTNIPQAEHIASFDSDVYPVCRESNYLQNNSFFLTLIEAIDTKNTPYYSFTQFDSVKHLSNMIKGKVELYSKWVSQKDSGLINDNGAGQKYFDYYRWVSNNVRVNDDYNFIPIDLLNARHRYYHKLVELGWTITDYGLFKQGLNSKVIPLIEVNHG